MLRSEIKHAASDVSTKAVLGETRAVGERFSPLLECSRHLLSAMRNSSDNTGSRIIFHLGELWKVLFILCDIMFLVRLQTKFNIDHSWEWKGWRDSVVIVSNDEDQIIRPHRIFFLDYGGFLRRNVTNYAANCPIYAGLYNILQVLKLKTNISYFFNNDKLCYHTRKV